MKKILFLLFSITYISIHAQEDSAVLKLRSLLDKNDLVSIAHIENSSFKDLFEQADSILLQNYLDSLWRFQTLKDTGSIALYNYLLLRRWQTMTEEDMKPVHETIKETEKLKDALKKQIKKVEEMSVVEPVKKSKQTKNTTGIKEAPCPPDEAKTLSHSGLRYLMSKNCSFDIPETVTQDQKDILLEEMKEAVKDFQRTLDINLATHHLLQDRKAEMDSWLSAVQVKISQMNDIDLKFHPDWVLK